MSSGIQITVGGQFSAIQQLQERMQSAMKRIRAAFADRIGHRMLDDLRAAAARAPEAIRAAIDAASDLGETISKVGEVFGEEAGRMVAWSADAATAFGQSRAEALAAAGDFGNLFQAMGVTSGRAAEMSRRLVELAADLASFHNTEVGDAVTAIGSALRGEAQPILRYGVLLNDATLKTQAMKEGLYNGKGTLDIFSRGLAAYSLILAQTASAQGDFARTSEGLANSQRIVAARFKDLQAEIGTQFLPAAEKFAAWLKSLDLRAVAQQTKATMDGFMEWGRAFQKIASFTPGGGLAKWIADQITANDRMIASFERMDDVLKRFNPKDVSGTAVDRAEIQKVLDEIEAARKALVEETYAAIRAEPDADKQRFMAESLDATIARLEARRQAVAAISDVQLDANRAVRDAAEAEERYAAALKASEEAYSKARAAFDKTMGEAARKRSESLPLSDQLAELDAAAEELRKSLPIGLRNPYASAEERAGLIEKFRQTGEGDPEMGSSMEAVQKLAEIEQRRDAILAKIREENAERLDAIRDYETELGIIRAQVEGNREKVAQLEREAEVRAKILELTRAGIDPGEARRRAEALMEARGNLSDVQTRNIFRNLRNQAAAIAGGKENEREFRIRSRSEELQERGHGENDARRIAGIEEEVAALRDMKVQQEGLQYGSTVHAASSLQRIGGGGGAYTAGLDYARQQTDLQRQMAATLENIEQKLPQSDFD